MNSCTKYTIVSNEAKRILACICRNLWHILTFALRKYSLHFLLIVHRTARFSRQIETFVEFSCENAVKTRIPHP